MTAADILVITALLVVVLVAIALLVAGAGLLLRLLSGRSATDPVIEAPLFLPDRQWHIERTIYRHHRLVGFVIIAASAYFLWQAIARDLLLATALPGAWQPLWWGLVVGNAFNLVIGILIITRPSLLKPIEAVTNRWFAVDSRRLSDILTRRPGLRAVLLMVVAMAALAGASLLLTERLTPLL